MTSPLKWHGGKSYLARRLVAMMPPHLHYVEPFAGGLSVMLAKDPEGVSEVANDLNGGLTDFWRTLADPGRFEAFCRRVECIPFSEAEWHAAGDDAAGFFVRCRQSLAGRMDCFAPLSRTRTRRGMNEQASAWMGAVDGLPAVHARLRRVAILNRPAVDVIRSQDGPDTLFYLDPPYLHETRATTGEYAHEMTADDHRELLAAIRSCAGKVMISGYPSGLYDSALSGWARHEIAIANHASGAASKPRKTEVIWCNFGEGVGE